MANGLGDAPDAGTIDFVHKHAAPLAAGEYAITVTHDLSNKDCTDPSQPQYVSEHPTRTRRFAIRGPRFSLDPGDLNAVFPPQGNRGEYSNCLPHAVLTGRTLPWVRFATAGDLDVPWLAVLLFEESEAPPIQTLRMQDLEAGAAAGVVSYGDAYAHAGQPFQTDFGENWTDPCRVIDVPMPVFKLIAPTLADAKLLAHSRTVNGSAKPGQTAPPPLDLGVIIGNRLPARNTRCTAHLVSIEMMGAFLPPSVPAAGAIRLVSLASWSFTSVDPAETFEQYLERAQPAPLRRIAIDDTTGEAAFVRNALDLGYSALAHQTRLGDQTVSWYRGPFVPYNATGRITVPLPDPQADPPTDGPPSADSLVRYDPDHQMLDVSYAAAWQLGRLLALQDRGFSIALYNWRRSVTRQTAASIERQIVHDLIGGTNVTLAAAPLRHAALHGAAAVVKATIRNALEAPAHRGRPRAPIFKRATVFTKTLQTISKISELADLHDGTPIPTEITDWLGRLRVFHGVPFNYLVADEAMLPPERIRFFQVDVNWTISLLEGALSIGRSTSSDAAHDLVFSPRLHAAAYASSRQVRAARPLAADPAPQIWSGFLLRSAVVSGWPGIEVYASNEAAAPLTILRLECLAPDLLLCIVEGAAAQIRIQEPSEALHFGLDVADDGVTLSKSLRYITIPAGVSGKEPGDQIDTVPNVSIAWHDATARVIDMTGLKGNLTDKLPAGAGPTGDDFTSAEFALEMVQGVQAVLFTVS